MKRIFATALILSLFMVGGIRADTSPPKNPWPPTDTIDIDMNFTGDRIETERLHIQYDLLDGTIADPWTIGSADHTTAWGYITSEANAQNCDGSAADTTCRDALVLVHFGDTTAGQSQRITFDRARGTGGVPLWAEDEDRIAQFLFGQWQGDWPGTFLKTANMSVFAEVEEKIIDDCDEAGGTEDDIFITSTNHGFIQNDLAQIKQTGTTLVNVDATAVYYVGVRQDGGAGALGLDEIRLCATAVTGAANPVCSGGWIDVDAADEASNCASATNTIRIDDGGGRFEFYTKTLSDNGSASLALTITGDQSIIVENFYKFSTQTEGVVDTGAMTITTSNMKIQCEDYATNCEGAGNTDDLNTLNVAGTGGSAWLILSAANSNHTIVLKHDIGNILMCGQADFNLDHIRDKVILIQIGGTWHCLSTADNG